MNKIIRIKNKNYTIISNAVLRDNRISLKAKGVIALIMSLPSDWDFSIKGLSSVVKEGRDSVYSAIKELKEYGYCNMIKCRDDKGKLAGTDYVFYENPQQSDNQDVEPCTENPDTDKPYTDNPDTGFPDTENPTQINKDIKEINKEYNIDSNESLSTIVDDVTRASDDDKDIMLYFNSLIDKHGSVISKLKFIQGNRKKMLLARIKQYGKDDVMVVLEKAVKSNFLNGQSKSNFIATFDWIIKPNNFPKVLEGNYDNKQGQSNGTTQTNQGLGQGSDHPSDSELRQQSIRIMQRLSAERHARNEAIRQRDMFSKEGDT